MNKFPPRSAAAFTLVEVALALGIAAFCMVTVFGLVPIGVNTNRASFEQTSAANVASAVAADLRSVWLTNPRADQTTSNYKIKIPGTPAKTTTSFTTLYVREDGTPSGVINENANAGQSPHYRVTLYFTASNTGGTSTTDNPNATTARILVTWPALADANAGAAPTRFAGSFETMVGLVASN